MKFLRFPHGTLQKQHQLLETRRWKDAGSEQAEPHNTGASGSASHAWCHQSLPVVLPDAEELPAQLFLLRMCKRRPTCCLRVEFRKYGLSGYIPGFRCFSCLNRTFFLSKAVVWAWAVPKIKRKFNSKRMLTDLTRCRLNREQSQELEFCDVLFPVAFRKIADLITNLLSQGKISSLCCKEWRKD